MSDPAPAPKSADVPTQVFEKFLKDMSAAGIPDDVVERFRKTLLEEKKFSASALREAVFGEEAAQ